VIDSLPIELPTEFILGVAGLASILGFVLGGILRLGSPASHGERIDPLRFSGYGAGTGGTVATALWLGSLAWKVLLS
jgi:hypothetical protein